MPAISLPTESPPMPPGFGRTLLKLLIASLIVGLLMRLFGVTPRSLVANFGENVEKLFNHIVHVAGWAFDYVILGAVIVLPIWLLVFLFDKLKGKRGG